MRIIPFLFLSFLFSCNSSVEKEKPIHNPSLENPWTYINRISDTLPETEFSLNNTVAENLEVLKKYDKDHLFLKYRVGQNRHIPTIVLSIQSYYAVCILYDYSSLHFGLNHSDELLINDESFFKLEPDLSNIICNKIIELEIRNGNSIKRIPFTVDFSDDIKQESVLKLFDLIAEGYLKFLDIVSKNKHKTPFSKLNKKLQNVIIKDYPLMLEYNFYRLMNRPNFLRLPKKLRVNL